MPNSYFSLFAIAIEAGASAALVCATLIFSCW
jgi:hypothetical protein